MKKHLHRVLLASTVLATFTAVSFASEAALGQLSLMAGPAAKEMPAVKTPNSTIVAAPRHLSCKMDLSFTESITAVGPIKLSKKIQGKAVVHCPNRKDEHLFLVGSGLSLGLIVPKVHFKRIGPAFHGTVAVLLPLKFDGKYLPGEYVKAGVTTPVGGVAMTQFVHKGIGAKMSFSLPKTVVAELSLDLTTVVLSSRK